MSTYNALIPLASDSPAIFPAQSQANFTRLQEIIEADHQFNNTAAANDGYHNLIHMTVQAPTGPLSGIGRLYVKTVSGLVQLYYMDDAGTEYEITPQYLVSPVRITGTANIGTGGVQIIIPTPAYDYTAIATVYINSTNTYISQSLVKTGAAAISQTFALNSSIPGVGVGYVGTDYQILNLTGSPQDFVWSIMLNRTT